MLFTLCLVAAFVLGGTAGVLVAALMVMAGDERQQIDPKRGGVMPPRA